MCIEIINKIELSIPITLFGVVGYATISGKVSKL